MALTGAQCHQRVVTRPFVVEDGWTVGIPTCGGLLLPQYPHEAEICFPPLTALEVRGIRIEGTTMCCELDPRLHTGSGEPEQSDDIAKFIEMDVDGSGSLSLHEFIGLAQELRGVRLAFETRVYRLFRYVCWFLFHSIARQGAVR